MRSPRRGAPTNLPFPIPRSPFPRQREPCQSLQRLAEPHLVREKAREPRVLEKAHPVYALLLIWPQDIVERAERNWLELRAGVAVSRRRSLAPAPRGGIVEVNAVEEIERRLYVWRVYGIDAEPPSRRAILRRRAVAEHAVHRFDRGVVEKDYRAVLHDVAVAAIQRGLYLDGRHLVAHRVKSIGNVERAVRSVAHRDDRHDGRHRVRKLHQLVGKIYAPTLAPESGKSCAEEVEHLLRVGNVKPQVAVVVPWGEAPLLDGLHRLALRLHRAHAPHKRIVWIGKVDCPRTLHRTDRKLNLAVVRVDLYRKRRARTGDERRELRLRLDFNEVLFLLRLVRLFLARAARLLFLNVVHLADDKRITNGDDMLAHHAEAPVRVARTMRLDATTGLQEERDRHLPSARLLDLAADLKSLIVVSDVVYVA